jgi:hypothetical protein
MARRHSAIGGAHACTPVEVETATPPRLHAGTARASRPAMLALLPSLVTVAVLLIGIVEERAAAIDRRRLGRVRPARAVALVATPGSTQTARVA